jgi:iron complex outermembrane receptor protein
MGYLNNRIVDDEIKQFAAQLEHELGGGFIKNVRAGGSFVRRDKSLTPDEAYLDLPGGATQAAVPASALRDPIESWLGLGPILTYDPRELLSSGFFEELPNTTAAVRAKAFDVKEKIGSIFLMADLNHEFGSGVLTGNIGVRGEHTNQRSLGYVVVPGTGPGTGLQPWVDGDKFWDVLPSANLNFRFHNDIVLRLAGAREIMRPRMDQMASRFSYGFDTSRGRISGESGNPRLRPYRAWAVDASIEKYWGTRGYVALTGFWKKLDSLIYNQTVEFDWAGFPNLDPRATTTVGLISQPINAKGGKIYGFELGGTLPFETFTPALDGFGITGGISYTVPRVKPGPDQPAHDIPGYSRWVMNGTAYFEKQGFSIRGSARHRTSYLGDFTGLGAAREYRRVKPETVIDGQVGYEFQAGSPLQGLSVFLQGLNLSDEPLVSHVGEEERWILNYEEYGRRFMLGATYKFGARAARPAPLAAPALPPPPRPAAATQTCPDGSVIDAAAACPVPPPPAAAPERG